MTTAVRVPQRIQRRMTLGWRKPEGAVVVTRPGRWGNPYRAIRGTVYGPSRPNEGGELFAYSTHAPARNAIAAAVDYYRRDVDCAIRSRLTTEAIRRELAGRDLACWCPLPAAGEPDICHGAVLLAIANGWEY